MDTGGVVDAHISLPEHLRPNHSTDVEGHAARHGIDYHEIEDINAPGSLDLIRCYGSDFLVCAWPKVLGKEVLELPKHGCIGTHPTELPFNRGRHPLHWLISMGISHTKLSFFRMDEGIDTGDMLLQVPIEIGPDDQIKEVTSKVNQAGYEGMRVLCKTFMEDRSYAGALQSHGQANYWRRRTPYDVTLDLRMSAGAIIRTVRSFAPPYPCANLIFEKNAVKISSATVADIQDMTAEEQRRAEPGRIISVDGDVIIVKTDDHIVELVCATLIPERLKKAKYIHPPSRYIAQNPELLA